MEPHQIMAILATFISVPFLFVIVWIDLFKAKDWVDQHGPSDSWGYKTKMVLSGSVFVRAIAFLLWAF